MQNFRIGELSRRGNVNVETIRYYERAGLLPPPARTKGGRRIYDEGDLKRLCFVRRCRELGFALDSVREMLQMVDDGGVTCRQVKAIAKDHLQDVRSKMSDLELMERTLEQTITQCDGGEEPDCPIIEDLFSGSAAN